MLACWQLRLMKMWLVFRYLVINKVYKWRTRPGGGTRGKVKGSNSSWGGMNVFAKFLTIHSIAVGAQNHKVYLPVAQEAEQPSTSVNGYCSWWAGGSVPPVSECVCVNGRMLSRVAKRFEWSVRLEKRFINAVHSIHWSQKTTKVSWLHEYLHTISGQSIQ